MSRLRRINELSPETVFFRLLHGSDAKVFEADAFEPSDDGFFIPVF
jgi:hypothetical protein